MKKNKKGFTLVELLAVIVILGIILTIAGTNVVKSIRVANEQEVKTIAKTLKDLGPDVYRGEKLSGEKCYVNASKLKNKEYLKAEPKLGKMNCSDAYLIIYDNKADQNYDGPVFESYVSCDGKTSGVKYSDSAFNLTDENSCW